MKNTIFKRTLITMGIMAMMSSLIGCTNIVDKGAETPKAAYPSYPEEELVGNDGIGEEAVDNESGIVYFSYRLNESMGYSYSYTIEKDEDKIMLSYEGMEERDYGTLETEISHDVLDKLEKLYKTYRVAEWDGYSKSNPNVLDGSGFSISIRFADGGKVYANGENAFPKGLSEFENEMRSILEPIKEKIRDEKRKEKISQGINGNLNSILVTFIQHGNSGRDEYNILITTSDVRNTNFEVYIKSRSGEYFPEGEYSCHRRVPDEVLNLSKVQEIIEKYDIIEWYDYSESDKDYNNKEWYQVDFGFDDDFDISSMGTVYPKNYKKFRKEFLTWLKETADVVDTLPEE